MLSTGENTNFALNVYYIIHYNIGPLIVLNICLMINPS